MRETIIGVFAVVVLIVSVLSFALMRLTLGDVSNKGEAQRAVTAAVAQLQVEGLRIERWLAQQANTDLAREPFDAGTPKTRADTATTSANTIEEQSKNAPSFAVVKPTVVVLFDAKGIVLARNGSNLMRGQKIGERHPTMMKAVLAGNTGSDVWVDKSHNEQLLTSYAPIRSADGKIIGGVAVGTAFNNGRLKYASEATSKSALLAAIFANDKMDVIARSNGTTDAMLAGADSGKQALNNDQPVALSGLSEDLDGAAMALGGYGDGKQAVIMAVTPARVIGSFKSLILSLLGAFAMGLLLTILSAHLINAYISQPIEDLEDGLLTIINGQTDIRFELEHKVLGGLVFRINSLLNQLLGVKEDDTDEEGRPSQSPSSQSFSAALNVDERMVALSADDVDDAKELRDEPPEDYYKRLYDEYIAAKSELGDPVDHIKFAPLCKRIKASEQQMAAKHGKPFRYKVELKGKEIVLVAVPLA